MSQRSETTELLIVLSEAARQSLRAGLIEDGPEIITQMLVDIDVEEAKAEQESGHRRQLLLLLLPPCRAQEKFLVKPFIKILRQKPNT